MVPIEYQPPAGTAQIRCPHLACFTDSTWIGYAEWPCLCVFSRCTVESLVRSEPGADNLFAQVSKENPIPGASQPETDV